jgi:hypothetical protein
MGDFKLLDREQVSRDWDTKLAAIAAAPPRIEASDVEAARQEYVAVLNAARNSIRHEEPLAVKEEFRASVEICRARYEALREAARERADERASAESQELAKTNIKLAISQTLIAAAVAAFTLLQLALAIAQAMKWIK